METLKQSDDNSWILEIVNEDVKSIVIDVDNNITSSKVSPYTIIKRTSISKDIVWRKKHE